MHAGAPEATALIGNVIAPDRLRVLAFADDAAEMPNLTMCDRENWPTTLRQNASAPILTTAPDKPMEHRNPYLIINRCAGKGVALTAGVLARQTRKGRGHILLPRFRELHVQVGS